LVRSKLELDTAQRQTNSWNANERKPTVGQLGYLDNLRRQYERRIQDVIQENNQLSEKVKNATTLLEVDSPVSTIGSAAIGAELQPLKDDCGNCKDH